MPSKQKSAKSQAAQAAAPAKGGEKKADDKGDKKKKKIPPQPNKALFERRPRNFGIGQHIQPTRDVTRFVRWPEYIRLQRQKRILMARLKVPPPINQFQKVLDKENARQVFKLLNKYRPETKQGKKQRLLRLAEAKAKDPNAKPDPRPTVVKYGLNQCTRLIESKRAQLVVIANDVDPIELVVWLPALCRKLEVPYCVVRCKARLGTVLHKKTATVLVLTDVHKEDKKDLATLAGMCMETYNNNVEMRRAWGGGKLGLKAVHVNRKKEKAIARETAAKNA